MQGYFCDNASGDKNFHRFLITSYLNDMQGFEDVCKSVGTQGGPTNEQIVTSLLAAYANPTLIPF